MSFAMADGRAIVDAVTRSDRILQVGSQGVELAGDRSRRKS